MPNFLVGTISASAPKTVAVGTTSTNIVPANNQRNGLILVNISDSTMYIAFGGQTATLWAGITLTPNGGVFSMDEYTYNKEAVNGIAHTAASTCSYQEFYVV